MTPQISNHDFVFCHYTCLLWCHFNRSLPSQIKRKGHWATASKTNNWSRRDYAISIFFSFRRCITRGCSLDVTLLQTLILCHGKSERRFFCHFWSLTTGRCDSRARCNIPHEISRGLEPGDLAGPIFVSVVLCTFHFWEDRVILTKVGYFELPRNTLESTDPSLLVTDNPVVRLQSGLGKSLQNC